MQGVSSAAHGDTPPRAVSWVLYGRDPPMTRRRSGNKSGGMSAYNTLLQEANSHATIAISVLVARAGARSILGGSCAIARCTGHESRGGRGRRRAAGTQGTRRGQGGHAVSLQV